MKPGTPDCAHIPRGCFRVMTAALASLSVMSTTLVQAGDVVGRVELAAPRRPASPRPRSYWREPNGYLPPVPRPPDLRRELAIALVGARSETFVPKAVQLQGGGLLPSTLVMAPGAILTFENRDSFTHEVYAEGLAALAPEAISVDQSRRVQISGTGGWWIRDRRLPHLQGYLHVVPKVAQVVQPDSEGKFEFKDVASGEYLLKVFRLDKELVSKPVRVEGERSVRMETLVLRPSGP